MCLCLGGVGVCSEGGGMLRRWRSGLEGGGVCLEGGGVCLEGNLPIPAKALTVKKKKKRP